MNGGGGIATYASSTSNTITLQGTTSWDQLGFYANNNDHPTRQVTIDGVVYTYTGGESTTTLTGVSPSPSGISIGDLIFQTPIIYPSSATNYSLLIGGTANLTSLSTTGTGAGDNNQLVGTALIATLDLGNNPTNGQVLTMTVNGTAINFTFVTTIGVSAGNVLIGANTQATATNLLGLLQNPATTSATQVALSGGNQTLIGYMVYSALGPGLALKTLDLIETYYRQLWLGSLINQDVYVSKVDKYLDYGVSQINAAGFGNLIQLDAPPVSFVSLENPFTISAGKNQWYQVTQAPSTYTNNANPSAPVVYDTTVFTIDRLKTNPGAGTQSQAMTSAMKNDVIFISNEPTMDTLGRVEQILGTTQTTNMSDPIKLDFDNYDFTDASIYYNKYFIYIAVPKEGVVRIYNIVKSYWEAPQTIPVSRFYTVDGQLYGHSYLTPESYQLFTGDADRVSSNSQGSPIPCSAVFSYQNFASPFTLKQFNKFYIEGYISSNTTMTLGITYDIDGCATVTTYPINGIASYVCSPTGLISQSDAALGKHPLGKFPLGGNLYQNSPNALPPKFRFIQTFPNFDFFECQVSFSSSQIGTDWEILRFGPALNYSDNIPTFITQ